MHRTELLLPGPVTLSVYADASFSPEVEVGCWAFQIPAFPIFRAGIEAAESINRLELAAVVHGLAAVATLDLANRPVQIYTDSEFVLRIMQHVSTKSPLPSRKSYVGIAELYDRACDLSLSRPIAATKRAVGDPHHTACDRRARKDLRAYCSQGRFAHPILLKRSEARRATLLNQLKGLERQVDKVERQLLACEMEIGALAAASVLRV